MVGKRYKDMKYIRTKDGIFEAVKTDKLYVYIKDYDYDNNEHYVRNIKLENIKFADTIEELCDFVFVQDRYHDYHLYDLKSRNTDKEYIKECWLDGWFIELYYCIKTDKGLIYVAKMTDRGELELLRN